MDFLSGFIPIGNQPYHFMRNGLFCLQWLLLLAACHSRMTYPPGGYPYPEHVSGKDTQFYRYPVKASMSRTDSMWDAKTYEDWQPFDEPNLSLRPMPTDVFRFIYGEALNRTIYILRMTPEEILVKIGTPTEVFEHLPDTSRLDTLERRLVNVLDRNYPLDEKRPNRSPRRQHYIDSMGQRYPRLYDPSYYIYLRNKEYPHSKPWYTFTTRTIKITSHDFDHWVDLINASGYWRLPYKMPCENPPFDGWGFSLEANTASRYNYVGAGSCDSTDSSRFNKACQELVRYAGLDRKSVV